MKENEMNESCCNEIQKTGSRTTNDKERDETGK